MAEDAGSGSAGGLQSYDLRRKELTAVPSNVWEMKNLSVLNLYMNKIESLPPDLGTAALASSRLCFLLLLLLHLRVEHKRR
jgi:Leucine-rich repeat (LRR) protein